MGASGQRYAVPRILCGTAGKSRALAHQRLHIGQQHIARQGGFTRTTDPGDGHQAFQRHLYIDFAQVVQISRRQAKPLQVRSIVSGRSLHHPPGLQRVLHGMQQITPGLGVSRSRDVCHGAFGHQTTATFARTGPDVDDVIGSANGVFVVFHHHQRVAFFAEFVQGVQQNLVVTGMQTDGGLVQYITNPLQITAQLSRQTNALRLAARQSGRTTVQGQVVQAHLFQKLQAAFDLGQQVTRNVSIASKQMQSLHPLTYLGHRKTGNVGDAPALPGLRAQTHGAGRRIQTGSFTRRTRHIGQIFNFRLGKGLLPTFVFVVTHRIVEHLALVLAQLDTRAHAIRAPAMLAVVRKQARVKFGIRGGALRAGTQSREHPMLPNPGRGFAIEHSLSQVTQIAEHMHHTFAVL